MSGLDPRLFAEGAARDSRFDVKSAWLETRNFGPDDPKMTPEFLHRQMHEEVNGLEMAARNLSDFPDADWKLRMAIARQCWDESRHVSLFRRCYERRGGTIGAYPVLNFQYRIVMAIESLVGRLAVQNRSFEAAGIDAIAEEVKAVRARGEEDLAELLDTQLADEVQHVRYANDWIAILVERGGPRAAFDVVQAVARANEALRIVAAGAEMTYPVAEDARREAGFSDGEIDAVRNFPNRPRR